MMQPMVRALGSQPMADIAHGHESAPAQLYDVRRQQSLDEGNADLGSVVTAAAAARGRQPFSCCKTISEQIIAGLDAYRVARDKMCEQMFFGFYGSPFVQSLLGINDDSEVRPAPRQVTCEDRGTRRLCPRHTRQSCNVGGFNEALTRAVLYVIAADRGIDQRCALALNVARKKLMHLSLAEFKSMVRDQFFVLQLEPDHAVDVLRPWSRSRRAQELLKNCGRLWARRP